MDVDALAEAIATHLAARSLEGRRWLTVKQAAQYSGLSVASIRRLLDAGKLQRHKPMGRLLLDRRAIDALIQSSK